MEETEFKEKTICQKLCGKVEIKPECYTGLKTSLPIVSYMDLTENKATGGTQWKSHSKAILVLEMCIAELRYNLKNLVVLGLPVTTPIQLKSI